MQGGVNFSPNFMKSSFFENNNNHDIYKISKIEASRAYMSVDII